MSGRMKVRAASFTGALLLMFATPGVAAADRWAAAESRIQRAPPSAFAWLPTEIVRRLERMGCTVPQSYTSTELHNVVSGEFMRRGRRDWAVLCSREGRSAILVFQGATAQPVAQLAPAPDREYLQVVSGRGEIGYSRRIEPVSRSYIVSRQRDFGGARQPRVEHDGINDAFAEKASVVHYHDGRWLQLQGAD